MTPSDRAKAKARKKIETALFSLFKDQGNAIARDIRQRLLKRSKLSVTPQAITAHLRKLRNQRIIRAEQSEDGLRYYPTKKTLTKESYMAKRTATQNTQPPVSQPPTVPSTPAVAVVPVAVPSPAPVAGPAPTVSQNTERTYWYQRTNYLGYLITALVALALGVVMGRYLPGGSTHFPLNSPQPETHLHQFNFDDLDQERAQLERELSEEKEAL